MEPTRPGEGPEDVVELRRQGTRVREAVLRLPLLFREVFVLYELEEMEGPVIAALLAIPENTVWSRLRKARTLFKAELNRVGGES